MLTNENLKSVEGLTDDQMAAIAAISKNAFEAAIGKRIGEIHSQYDADFKAATGIEKPPQVKSYVFWKEQMQDFKTKAEQGGEGLKKELEALKAEKAELEQKVKDGKGNEALKQQLADKESLIKQLKEQRTKEAQTWEGKYKEALSATKSLKINNEFDQALTGLSFKSEKMIPKEVRQTFVSNAKSSILAEYQADFEPDGQGGNKLVFRKEGDIVRDPQTMAPLSAGDLLAKAIKPIIAESREQGGGGTGGQGGGNPPVATIGQATTQPEAYQAIHTALNSQGLAVGTNEYQEAFDKAWTENNVSAMPPA